MLELVLGINGKIPFAEIRTSKDIFSTEKYKVTFGLKYIIETRTRY